MLLEELNPSGKIYVDMDGVIADFVQGVKNDIIPDYDDAKYDADSKYRSAMWKAVTKFSEDGGELWFNLPLMDDAHQLWDYVKRHDHEILSATGKKSYNAAEQKRRWISKHFGNVKVNLVQKAVEKAGHARPGDILIDDKMKAIQPWRDAGGIGILHTSAADTIRQLKELGM